MKILSPGFKNNELIPSQYTCEGKDISPPLTISDLPEGTESLVLIVDDPDAPIGTWDHWVLWNINPSVGLIEENSLPQGAIRGKNSFGNLDYGGPCPPFGTHRYCFKLYALDSKLDLKEGSTKKEIERAMTDHVLGLAELVGLYKKGL